MKQGFKLLTVLLLTLLLTVSATAQINWLKQDGSVKYLAWDNGSHSKTIYNGNSATFTTGYFGSTAGQIIHVTVTINSKTDGKIVKTLVSKDVNVGNSLGYQVITVLPEHYKNKVGEYIIVIKLKDANKEEVDTSLYLKVKPNLILKVPPIAVFISTAPDMNAVPDKEVFENQNLQFTVSATDVNGDDLTYEAKVCWKFGNSCLWFNADFVGASFNQNTGKFSWNPSYDFVKHPSLSKNIDFRFRADDGDEKSAWELATITVKDVNRNPVFDNIPNKVVQEEQVLQFTVNATDADNDTLEYSILTASPSLQGASLDKDTGVFKLVPTDAQAGLYSVTFKVVDNFGGKDLENVLITVTNVVKPQCDDNLDNDGDGVADENDPGCHTDGNPNNPGSYDPTDNDETDPVDEPECKDGKDNDGDGKKDKLDPGCHTDGDPNNDGSYNPNDDDEKDPVDLPECKDGKDNDGDGKIDYPNDPGCKSKDDNDETDEPVLVAQCNDGKDNDRDTLTDINDPGCHTDNDPAKPYNPDDHDESNDPPVDEPQCNDRMDNDNDGAVDLHDPGCFNNDDNNEADDPVTPQCDDGIDNDLDMYTDYPADQGCSDQQDNDESNPLPPQDTPKTSLFTNIKFKSAHVEENIVYPGKIVAVHVHIFNNGKTDLKDVEIQATMYDIGAFGSTSDFNLSKGKGASKTVYVPIPEEAQPGWHLVKITAKNYHYHTSTYRLAYIDSNTFQ